MRSSLKDLPKIEIDAREILFFKENAPTGFIALVREALSEKGVELSRDQVMRELTILKKEYIADVISEARRIIKALKGVEYDSEPVHQ